MNKFGVCLLTAVLTAFCLCGCASGGAAGSAEMPRVVPDPRIPADREPEAKAAAEKMALGMAEALKTGDFEKFNAVQPKFNGGMTKAAFAKRREALSLYFGNMTGAEYLGCLKHEQVNDYLWKFSFEAPAAEGSAAARRHEIIYWVRVGFADGAPRVAGFGFDLH